MSRVRDFRAFVVAGGIVPASLATKIQVDDVAKESVRPESYHLAIGENLRDGASRAWSYLKGAYHGWRKAQDDLPNGIDDTRAQLTRERWLLLLLRELGYGMVPAAVGGVRVDGDSYPVSHRWEHVPIHLLGPGVALDRRTAGVAGAARQPQAMVQELLNRTDQHLWALVSNGRKLRILRDSTDLVGSAYIEFDLEAIFEGELFADFFLMWRIAHASRLEKRGGSEASAADCWLEAWRAEAHESGTRVLRKLGRGVEKALRTLGNGFLTHPQNGWLADALRAGNLSRRDYYRALLRLAYRLLFVFVAEDRGLLLDRESSPEARARYDAYFSSDRLRRLARRPGAGNRHGDLWQAQRLVLAALGGDGVTTGRGEPLLGLPALSGLFDPDRRLPSVPGAPDPDLLTGAQLTNRDFLAAIRNLAWLTDDNGRQQRVDYRNIDSEELGSVYESLLELEPEIDDGGAFSFTHLAGNERKSSGSYYTPAPLVSTLLDTALDPLIKQAGRDAADAERKLLSLTVCDPACGSGHFLVAAARRIAQRLAEVRAGDDAPSDDDIHHALRDVVSRCIYGVDLNDMAAELAKVSLWMEAVDPGKPLGFLDAHIKVGNSLLGTTPALLAKGVPTDAFKVLTGDDPEIATAMRAQNRLDRKTRDTGQLLLDVADLGMTTSQLARTLRTNGRAASENVDETRAAAVDYLAADISPQVRHARQIADAWCAAFMWLKTKEASPSPHEGWLCRVAETSGPATDDTALDVAELAHDYRFFHWHIEFPEIFSVDGVVGPEGWAGGFSCVVGNPPWERIKPQEKEFFAGRNDEIANAPNAAARGRLIDDLDDTDPWLAAEWATAKRRAEGVSHFAHESGRYPLCGRGDINTYAVFAEHFRAVLAAAGRMGIVTPTGFATDLTTAAFFADTLRQRSLVAFYDFENEAKIFPGVDHRVRFAATCLTGGEPAAQSRLAFVVRFIDDLATRILVLEPHEVLLLNPNTGNLPLFRSRYDAEIAIGVYRRHPVLMDDVDHTNPWGLRLRTLFHMSNDSELFRTADTLSSDDAEFDGWAWTHGSNRWLPLYEGKLLSHYDHRYTTYDGATEAQLRMHTLPRISGDQHDDPNVESLARYWLDQDNVANAFGDRWDRDWVLGWRDIARASDARTFVPSVLPRAAVGNKFPLALLTEPTHAPWLQAVWSSYVFDYVSRQKLSGTGMTYFIVKQLACPAPATFEQVPPWSGATLGEWVVPRVLELSYTSWRIRSYAVDFSHDGPPYRWLPERRALIRAELDAAMMHIYGLERAEAEHVLDSFPVVRNNDEAEFEEFRTKRLIVEVYDEMAEATKTGEQYQTILDPPPGEGPRHLEASRPNWAYPKDEQA